MTVEWLSWFLWPLVSSSVCSGIPGDLATTSCSKSTFAIYHVRAINECIALWQDTGLEPLRAFCNVGLLLIHPERKILIRV